MNALPLCPPMRAKHYEVYTIDAGTAYTYQPAYVGMDIENADLVANQVRGYRVQIDGDATEQFAKAVLQ